MMELAIDVRARERRISLFSRRLECDFDLLRPDPESLAGLELSGWAFHRDVPVTAIEISVSGQPPFTAEVGIERPDVCAAFPNDDVGNPGFRATLHVLEGPITLRLSIHLRDGRTIRVWRVLSRPQEMEQYARGVYGAPDRRESALQGLCRDLWRHGRLGRYIWESRRIRGWARGVGEAEALAKASASLPDSAVVVEVGSFLGCSSALLAGARKSKGSGRVHCIDTFTADSGDEATVVYRTIANSLGMSLRQAFDLHMQRAGLSPWVTVHQMHSADVVREWSEPIDMLYLDGDVSTAGAREIFLSWIPHLRPGGILAINGTVERPTRSGAYRIVQEFVRSPDYQEIRRVDHITFARKRPEQDG